MKKPMEATNKTRGMLAVHLIHVHVVHSMAPSLTRRVIRWEPAGSVFYCFWQAGSMLMRSADLRERAPKRGRQTLLSSLSAFLFQAGRHSLFGDALNASD